MLSELLFETPVRIHKYIINNLIRAHAYNIINGFIDRVITGAKQYPEIFIWVARNLFSKQWDYDWLDYSRERLAVTYFRLMNELKKIEMEGNRLKNMALDVLFDNNSAVLKTSRSSSTRGSWARSMSCSATSPTWRSPRRRRSLASSWPVHADFQPVKAEVRRGVGLDVEKLIVSREGYEKMKAEPGPACHRGAGEHLQGADQGRRCLGRYHGRTWSTTPSWKSRRRWSCPYRRLDEEMKKAAVLNLDEISTDAVNIGTRSSSRRRRKARSAIIRFSAPGTPILRSGSSPTGLPSPSPSSG